MFPLKRRPAPARVSPVMADRARRILRESAGHTMAELTNPSADVAVLAEQARQSAMLAASVLNQPLPSRRD